MEDIKLSKVKIKGFKGIPQNLSINFNSPSINNPVSLILSGDNGAGKSSIVEAIEFALQGNTYNKKIMIHSLTGSYECHIEINLTDDSTHELYLSNEKSENIIGVHPKFCYSPFALRRSDILKIWEISDSERRTIFDKYLTCPILPDETGIFSEIKQQSVNELKEKRVQFEVERRDLIDILSEKLDVLPDGIPINNQSVFTSYIHKKLYRGSTHKQSQGIDIEYDNEIQEILKKVVFLIGRIQKIQSEIRKFERIKTSILEEDPLELSKNILINAGERITDSFKKISNIGSIIKGFEITFKEPAGIDIKVKLIHNNKVIKNKGRGIKPERFFSESNLDLLALLIFLAFIKESSIRGQTKFLILDDVLQSVDSSIRLRTFEHIIDEFSDWQLMITIHDRLWLEQLKGILRQNNHNFIESQIIKWKFDLGPTIISKDKEIGFELNEALESGDVIRICSQAGLLLERICHNLSYSLPISVTRRIGDKYTLGDLWPGIKKILSKTDIKKSIEELDRWAPLRNLIGAHYNEWAQTLSEHDAISFGESVLELLSKVYCDKCFFWIEKIQSISGKQYQSTWACRCNKLKIKK